MPLEGGVRNAVFRLICFAVRMYLAVAEVSQAENDDEEVIREERARWSIMRIEKYE